MATALIPDAPAVPDSSVAEPTFDAQFEAFLQWQKSQLVPGINAVLPVLDQAVESSAAAIAGASYKGLWSALSGPLNIPASASHAGQLWMLLSSVANVAAEEPGVSLKWLAIGGTPKFDLISTTNAAAVASVEWTNFEALAGTYAALRLVADGIVGSAATADLKGELRQNGAWITDGSSLYLSCTNLGGSLGGTGINAAGALKNVATQAISLDMDIIGLGRVARPNVRFSSMGGTHSGGDSAAYWMYGGVTSSKSWTPTTPAQGLRIYPSTGTLTGTFRLYGVRK